MNWKNANQISDIGIRVVDHGILEGPEEVFLELEMRQFLLL